MIPNRTRNQQGLLGRRGVPHRFGLLIIATAGGLGLAACTPPPPAPPPPPPTEAPAPATPATPLLDALWQAINQDRAANGLPALAYNTQLAGLAQDWANQLAATETLVHRDLSAVLADPAYAGFWTLGENLFAGPDTVTATDIETAWMNSPEHRAYILSPNFNVMGAGATISPDGQIWVVVNFGGLQ